MRLSFVLLNLMLAFCATTLWAQQQPFAGTVTGNYDGFLYEGGGNQQFALQLHHQGSLWRLDYQHSGAPDPYISSVSNFSLLPSGSGMVMQYQMDGRQVLTALKVPVGGVSAIVLEETQGPQLLGIPTDVVVVQTSSHKIKLMLARTYSADYSAFRNLGQTSSPMAVMAGLGRPQLLLGYEISSLDDKLQESFVPTAIQERTQADSYFKLPPNTPVLSPGQTVVVDAVKD